jgi:hypothetical protein
LRYKICLQKSVENIRPLSYLYSRAKQAFNDKVSTSRGAIATEKEVFQMSNGEELNEEILSQIGLSKENRKKLEELYGNKNPKFS